MISVMKKATLYFACSKTDSLKTCACITQVVAIQKSRPLLQWSPGLRSSPPAKPL